MPLYGGSDECHCIGGSTHVGECHCNGSECHCMVGVSAIVLVGALVMVRSVEGISSAALLMWA